jgi:hypothetical protein
MFAILQKLVPQSDVPSAANFAGRYADIFSRVRFVYRYPEGYKGLGVFRSKHYLQHSVL